MLDWAGRIDDLAGLLAREHGIEDRMAIEILLSALVPSARIPSVWLILETSWYSRDCLDGWFSFGEAWVPCSLPRLRARNPWRAVEAETKEWLESPSDERLFIEPDFDRYPIFHYLTQAQYILQRTLRLHTRGPMRVANPLRSLDKFNQERQTEQLRTATRHVLEDRIHARPADPPQFVQPENFLYHVELVQRLAPWYRDWSILLVAFGALAVRHAYLHGRTETDEEDNRAIARVAADSISPWIQKALRLLLDGPSTPFLLEKAMGLEEKSRRSGHGAHRELVRLRRNGIIRWNMQKMHWTLADDHRQGILDVLDGNAFGVERGSAAGLLKS